MSVLCFFGAKGGVGCSVVATATALFSAKRQPTLLVDFGGDCPPIIGASLDDGALGLGDWLESSEAMPDALARLERPIVDGLSILPAGTGPLVAGPEERLRLLGRLLAKDGRRVIVDNGPPPLMEAASQTVLVTRACYVALWRARSLPKPDTVVLVAEAGRALRDRDVLNALGCQELVSVPYRPEISRAVDAGLLAARLPRALRPLAEL